MLSNELIIFCNRWLEKADKYSDDSTDEVYDKFFSLYVVYNAIYFESTLELQKKDKKISTRDRNSAIINIPKYIGQDILYDKLIRIQTEINQIIELINNNVFHLSINKNDHKMPNYEEDRKLIENIQKNTLARNKKDKQKYNEAVLTLIYETRCNMFHGQKAFEDNQMALLTPMNNILEVIIKDLLLTVEGRI